MTSSRPISTGSSSNNLNPWQIGAFGIGGAAAANSFFQDTPEFNNPANAARPYFERIPETIRPYFEPYIQQGQRANEALTPQYESMSRNPTEFLSNIGSNYKESPGYQFRLNQAMTAANNAHAAGGTLGTPYHVQNAETVASGLAGEDYENYLNHVLGILGGGQAGLQGLSDRGYGASTGYGASLASALMNQGLLEQRGAEAQNKYEQDVSNQESSGWGDLASLAFKALPYLGAL